MTLVASFSGGAKKLRTASMAMIARAMATRTRGGIDASRPFFFVCDMICYAPGFTYTRIYYSKVVYIYTGTVIGAHIA